jgi:hypothetical protein
MRTIKFNNKKGIVTQVLEDIATVELVEKDAESGLYVRTGEVFEAKPDEMEDVEFDVKKDLAHEFELFQKGLGSRPVVYYDAKITTNENNKLVILTLEDLDRDGEVVEVDGWIEPTDKALGVPMLDSHKMYDGVTMNGLGAVRNLRKTKIDGKKAIVGEPDFAPTPHGEIAKVLYLGVDGGKPYFTNVSMGFGVYDYDRSNGHIKEWELYECSLVTTGANRGASFTDKKSVDAEDVGKKLARYDEIHPVFKEFTKLFLSTKFCETIGYSKDGDILVDVNGVYDTIIQKFNQPIVEAPPAAEVEAPPIEPQRATEEIRQAQKAHAEQAIISHISSKIENIFNDF